MFTAKEIAQSLNVAAIGTQIRRERLAKILNRHPDGYTAAKWSKFTVCGDVFWTNGKKNLTSGQLLEALGTQLVKTGALSEVEYYG